MIRYVSAVIIALCCLTTFAADTQTTAVAVLPGDAPVVIRVPDGAAVAKAVSESDFGKLFAETETQQFVSPILEELKTRYTDLRKAQPFLPDVADLQKVLSGEMAIGVFPFENDKPGICAVLRTPNLDAVSGLLKPLLQGKPLAEGQLTLLGETGSFVSEKGFVLFSNNNALLEKMRGRAADAAKRTDSLESEKSWTTSQKLLGANGLFTIHVAAQSMIQGILAAEAKTNQDAPAKVEKIKANLAKTGLDKLLAISLQGTTREKQIGVDLGISVDGPPTGFLSTAFNIKQIPASTLTIVPENSTFCSVSQINIPNALKMVRSLLEGNAATEFETNLNGLKTTLGTDIETELLDQLSETWTIYDVGGTEIFGMFPSIALSVQLKDPAKVAKSANALLDAAQRQMAGIAGMGALQVDMRETKIGAEKVRYLSVSTLPCSPSLSIVKDRLLVTMSINGMRRAIAQLAAPGNITTSTDFKTALERVVGHKLEANQVPGQFTYTCADKRSGIGTVANFGQVITNAIKMQKRMMAQWGQPLSPDEQMWMSILDKVDFALFPSDEVVVRYMKPVASVMVTADGGTVYRSDLTVPNTNALLTGQGGAMSAGVMAAIAIPSLLRSRMAANETAAAACCKAYAEAQEIYHRTDYTGDGTLKYAQSLRGNIKLKAVEVGAVPDPTEEDKKNFAALKAKLSSDDFAERETATKDIAKMGPRIIKLLETEAKNSKDTETKSRCEAISKKLKGTLVKGNQLDTRYGLFSSGKEGQEGDLCLIDRTFALAEGNPSDHPTPKAGYCFKILAAQGEHATGGKRSYLQPAEGDPTQRKMTLGYALIAYPAEYDKTGRDCFMINGNGTIFQKDMGKDTHKIVEEMTEFDPDQTWVPTQ